MPEIITYRRNRPLTSGGCLLLLPSEFSEYSSADFCIPDTARKKEYNELPNSFAVFPRKWLLKLEENLLACSTLFPEYAKQHGFLCLFGSRNFIFGEMQRTRRFSARDFLLHFPQQSWNFRDHTSGTTMTFYCRHMHHTVPQMFDIFFGGGEQKHIVAGRGLDTNTDSASFVTAGAKRNLIFFVSFREKLRWVGRDPPKGLSRRKNHPWIDTHLFFLCQTSPHDENSKRRTTVSREK